LDGLLATYSYKDPNVRKAIEAIKFGFNRELVKVLVGGRTPKLESDLVVPVPLHWRRLNWRGFNQAEEIAKAIDGQPLRLSKMLIRTKNTKQQARLKLEERKENVKGAFKVVNRDKLKGKRILLMDDVFTTGESMKECCRVLKRAGASQVWGLVLAR